MIKNKVDLDFYLSADKYALGKNYKKPKINDEIWKFQIFLRKSEFYRNGSKNFINFLLGSYYRYRKHKLGILLGFDIGDNVFGPGLRINHYGNIVVSPLARVGMWCDIHQGVNIGVNNSVDGNIELVPIIGHNVWIGPGVKIFGKIKIGNNNVLGANAVVTSGHGDNKTLVGIPAKVIKNSGTESLNVAASENRTRNYFVDDVNLNRIRSFRNEFDSI
ncbi:serine O-acetyltransferase [Shewanella frigidimarina]|uniref:serine O-acetyltransferase n=1 Tax=Shewanella frigidimarina TaxID=56812 RepID=UPI003D78B3D3